jgi:hypothetical protein
MPTYADFHASPDLVSAVRNGADLPPEQWEELLRLASPYQKRVARMMVDPTVAPHGVPSTYNNYGCRCDACRAAYADWKGKTSTRSDFSEETLPPGKDDSSLEKALYARRMGWALTERAEQLLAEHDAVL